MTAAFPLYQALRSRASSRALTCKTSNPHVRSILCAYPPPLAFLERDYPDISRTFVMTSYELATHEYNYSYFCNSAYRRQNWFIPGQLVVPRALSIKSAAFHPVQICRKFAEVITRGLQYMPGHTVVAVESVKESFYCPHCRLLLRDAVQNEEGFRLCQDCCDLIKRFATI